VIGYIVKHIIQFPLSADDDIINILYRVQAHKSIRTLHIQ